MLRRITEGLKGGILRVASIAEVAARLLVAVGGAPGCGRASSCPACPSGAVGGCWIMPLRDCLAATECAKSWWWLLALVCLWASGFCGAGLWDSPSESGAAFLLRVVGVPALCPVHLSVPVHT
jgi:hypothetical protein